MSLADLSREWNEYGCSVCGIHGRNGELGNYIELHHLNGRGFPDADAPENIMGLCGAFLNRCHASVTENEIWLSEVEGVGWVWQDHRSGTQGVCRSLANRVTVVAAEPRPLYDMKAGMAVPDEYLPADARFEDDSLEACERRLELTRHLVRQINRVTLDVALIVYEVAVRREFQRLPNMPTIKEWADAAEISPPSLSKMLVLGKYFRGKWQSLPEAVRKDLSVDNLYHAAKLGMVGVYDNEDEALAAAVAVPQRYLWQQLREVAQAGRHFCECPTCGQQHLRREPT